MDNAEPSGNEGGSKPVKVMRSFEAEEEAYKKFKSTLALDGQDVGEKINEFIRNFNKEFGDGNPGFSLDPFMDNESMAAVPAVFRKREDWITWLKNCKNEEFLQEVMGQAQVILHLTDTRILDLRGHSVTYV